MENGLLFGKRLGPGQHLIIGGGRTEDGSSIMAETSIAIEIYADQSTNRWWHYYLKPN